MLLNALLPAAPAGHCAGPPGRPGLLSFCCLFAAPLSVFLFAVPLSLSLARQGWYRGGAQEHFTGGRVSSLAARERPYDVRIASGLLGFGYFLYSALARRLTRCITCVQLCHATNVRSHMHSLSIYKCPCRP